MDDTINKIGKIAKIAQHISKKGNEFIILKLILKDNTFEFITLFPKDTELILDNFVIGDFIKVFGVLKLSDFGSYLNIIVSNFYKLVSEHKKLATWDNISTKKWISCSLENALKDKDYVKSEEKRNKEDKFFTNKDTRRDAWKMLAIDDFRENYCEGLNYLNDNNKVRLTSFIRGKVNEATYEKKDVILGSESVFNLYEERIIKDELVKKYNFLFYLAKSYFDVYILRNSTNSHEKIKSDAKIERIRRNKELTEIHGQKYDFIDYLLNNKITKGMFIKVATIKSVGLGVPFSYIEIEFKEELIKVKFDKIGFFYITDNRLTEADNVILIFEKINNEYKGLFIAKYNI